MKTRNDGAVIRAMGTNFERFQKLAALAKEQPATRGWAEAEMARILNAMSPNERITLRKALIDAGVR